MKRLWKQIKELVRASLLSYVFFLFLLGVGVAFSYLEEFLRAMGRPEPLPSVARYGTICALLTDMIVFGKLLVDAIIHMWSKKP